MSTKIFNGFRFEPGGMAEALERVEAFRPILRGLEEEHLRRIIALSAVARVDASRLREMFGVPADEETMAGGPLFRAWASTMQRREEARKSQYRNGVFDTRFELWLFLHPRRSLGMVSTEMRAWRERWLRFPGIRPWPYWDNSDRPSRVSAREWEARGREWEERLGPRGIPADHCLSVDLSNPMPGHGVDFMKSCARAAMTLATARYAERVENAARLLAGSREVHPSQDVRKGGRCLDDARAAIAPRITMGDLRGVDNARAHLRPGPGSP